MPRPTEEQIRAMSDAELFEILRRFTRRGPAANMVHIAEDELHRRGKMREHMGH